MEVDSTAENQGRHANAAITRFLEFYIRPNKKFDYAVMVNGPWGCGKTHLVKEFLNSKNSNKYLYISLNGISSTDQIDQEFFRQLHPVLSSSGMRVAGAVVRAFAKSTLKIDVAKPLELMIEWDAIDLTKKLNDSRDNLLIFDDLERCIMPIEEVLGYINGFVEHDGRKTIIIANEEEIQSGSNERYRIIKEKLIGQTLTVSAPAEEAFDAFIEQIADRGSKTFLKKYKNSVIDLHAQGGRGNLRTLKFAIWDFERIGIQLETRHWDRELSVLKLMKIIMAISMEHRAGNLKEGDLSSLIGFQHYLLGSNAVSTEETKSQSIRSRYPQVDFNDQILLAPTLEAILLRGEMNEQNLLHEINASADYADPKKQPLWIRALTLFETDDITVKNIIGEINTALRNYHVTEPGEFFHLVGVRLWLTKIGILSINSRIIVKESKNYINTLEQRQMLKTALDEPRGLLPEFEYHGIGFFSSETNEFCSIRNHYMQAAYRQEIKKYRDIAETIINSLIINPDNFYFFLVQNNIRPSLYHSRPILAYLSPQEFVNLILNYTPAIQIKIFDVLHQRHQFRQDQLKPEREWIGELKAALETKIDAPLMSNYRLRILIKDKLDPILGQHTTPNHGA